MHRSMKQICFVAVALVFLFCTMGFRVATHFCGGTVAVVKLVSGGEKASCGMEDGKAGCDASAGQHLKKSCCSDYVQPVSLENVQPLPVTANLSLTGLSLIFFVHLPQFAAIDNPAIAFHSPGKAPPPPDSCPALSLLQVFRI